VDAERARQRLAEEREQIQKQIAELGQSVTATDETPDFGDQGSDLQEDETEFGLRQDLQQVLEQIEKAEGRIEDGSYGKSVISGEPIPDERLEALPWADRLVEEEPGGRS